MIKLAGKLKHITPPTITRCIFCGTARPLTNEHVFPRWCHRFLPNTRTTKYASVRGIRGPSVDQFHLVRRSGDIRDWKIPCVCTPRCNNGWMRQDIENRARPIMIPLIRGESVRITPAQQAVIATWAGLKAMVAEWTVIGHVTTHHMQRKRMMRRRLPPEFGWSIWIGRFMTNPAKPAADRYLTSWESHPFLLLPDKSAGRPDKKATYFNSNTSTQVIGQLFIQTLRSPMPNLIPRWRFRTPDRGTLFRIWPPSNTSIMWPAQTLTDHDAIYTANAFMNFVLGIQRAQTIGAS